MRSVPLFRHGRPGRRTDPHPHELHPTDEEILADLRDPLPSGHLEFGVPTRCPRCDDYGYIDRLDLVRRVMQLHCPTCRYHWQISEEQIEQAEARARGEPQA
jgi:hypothetical protein